MRWHRVAGKQAVVFFLSAAVVLTSRWGAGQERRDRERRGPRYEYAEAFAERDRTPPADIERRVREQREKNATIAQRANDIPQLPIATATSPPDPSACYKDGTNLELNNVRLDFANTGFKWPQPGGLGSPITITYSYSNLLDGQMRGLTAAQLKQGVEEALRVWASAAPLNFVEVTDSGPVPTRSDTNYAAPGRPQIRFGHHTIDGASGPILAHSYLPYSQDEGPAGDVHFDRDEDWSGAGGGFFLETVLHELGHSLGLDHEVVAQAIMNPVIANRFTGLNDAFLLADDRAGIRAIYGQGIGGVTPLEDEVPDDGGTDPGTEVPDDVASAVTAAIDSETGALVIAGDALDNQLRIASWWWGTVVMGRNGTTVNGAEWEFFSTIQNGNIVCELGTGNDELMTFHLRATSLDCDLGEGDDKLVLVWSKITTLTADGGTSADGTTGNDTITRIAARIDVETVTGFEVDEIIPRWWRWWRHWWGGGKGNHSTGRR